MVREFGIRSDQISRSVVSNSLWPHESQHARPPRSSPTPGVHSDSRPSSLWCHPAISSSVVPFSSCPQSLPASECLPMSQLFTWGGQSTGVSALAIAGSKNCWVIKSNFSYYFWPPFPHLLLELLALSLYSFFILLSGISECWWNWKNMDNQSLATESCFIIVQFNSGVTEMLLSAALELGTLVEKIQLTWFFGFDLVCSKWPLHFCLGSSCKPPHFPCCVGGPQCLSWDPWRETLCWWWKEQRLGSLHLLS